ncbi:winged helix DNA-binding domain-containing protein [Gordonia amarae]|uniref:Winged helix DNA-binding domain-containing protein n=2 Tax=Gordonia amarae TaxID=36821 RepID=G7GTG9_9ACTN|nr:winged helix DNA-binding domain-containing protein [Gordonia amarae]MCS3876640.1 hypothetical protein [Gordonia amarae]QHN19526.1 winged helix DNA-binding domain-containing protein [Gordonia amarae]QHN24002.1 winged helix DNA-binding domain-containing protein [Gordonia amarae]QHN32911.1 winged helix DNA-binding domain-containing protein [Gordonia amarae]QHN41631.1 winged helix DNA-binding domain-containing protein [Gordonia amarae]
MSDRLSLQQWNRTLLQRQHLLERVDDDAVEVLDRVVGMQSQDPKAAFFGLHARLENFAPDELDGLMTDRETVRMALLRSTVCLVDTEDARWIRPAVQPALDAELTGTHTRRLVAASPEAIVDAARTILADGPIAGDDLGKRLAQRFPDEAPATLTRVVRCALALVQVPPRGLWSGRGKPTYALFDDWVGPAEPALTGDDARAELIRLYLRGFGPATVAAIQMWSGIGGLTPLVEKMEADWELEKLTGPDGETLYDLDGLGLADPGEPAPVRLLAPYDHVIAAAADRRRVAGEDALNAIKTANGQMRGLILVDGWLSGTWSVAKARGKAPAEVAVELFGEPAEEQRAGLDAEVERLREFVAN